MLSSDIEVIIASISLSKSKIKIVLAHGGIAPLAPDKPRPCSWHQIVPSCTEWWCTEANKATQTHCYNPLAPTYPVWAYYAHGWQRRCQEDPVSLPFGRLEKTTRSSLHHMAQHCPTGSHLMLPKAADLAQNRPLWWMMSTYGATQSWAACQKRRWRRVVMTYLNRQYWKSSSPNVTFCINSFE